MLQDDTLEILMLCRGATAPQDLRSFTIGGEAPPPPADSFLPHRNPKRDVLGSRHARSLTSTRRTCRPHPVILYHVAMIHPITPVRLLLFLLLTLYATAQKNSPQSPRRPNILWIILEDWSPDLSCYGTKGVSTPNIDKLAAEGVRYTRAFTTAPVCSASRSAMLTGHYQNYTRAHQHRTETKNPLPHGILPFPTLLSKVGYFTALGCGAGKKTDHNFSTPLGFLGKHWRQAKPKQPFFGQATFAGTHRTWQRDPKRPIDPKDVVIPPYYPDTPLVRRDWANGLEQAQVTDRRVGKLLARLESDGLAASTLVILIGDHGRCMPRGKQFLYDGGLHIPLIMRWPGHIKPGTVSDDLVTSLDITRTILDVAGAQPTHPLHGVNLFTAAASKRRFIFAARDKMDNTHDAMRAVRTRKFKYIQNLMPERPYCQYNRYKETSYPTLAVLNVMNMKGKLNEVQSAFMAAKKPPVELYDLQADPWEVKNLAGNPQYSGIEKELRGELDRWRVRVNDQGVTDDFRAGGWPSSYPTRSLKAWESALQAWKPWVFRAVSQSGRKLHPRRVIRGSSLEG